MFEPGHDQADGLKRLFRPARGLQIHLLAARGCRDPGTLAGGLVRRLGAHGVDAVLERPGASDAGLARVLLSPVPPGGEARCTGERRQNAVLLARPEPAALADLYAAIKRIDGVLSGDPVLVLWEPGLHASWRDLCETNLARTAARFLQRSVHFHMLEASASGAVPSQGPALEWMSQAFVQRLDRLGGFVPSWSN